MMRSVCRTVECRERRPYREAEPGASRNSPTETFGCFVARGVDANGHLRSSMTLEN